MQFEAAEGLEPPTRFRLKLQGDVFGGFLLQEVMCVCLAFCVVRLWALQDNPQGYQTQCQL